MNRRSGGWRSTAAPPRPRTRATRNWAMEIGEASPCSGSAWSTARQARPDGRCRGRRAARGRRGHRRDPRALVAAEVATRPAPSSTSCRPCTSARRLSPTSPTASSPPRRVGTMDELLKRFRGGPARLPRQAGRPAQRLRVLRRLVQFYHAWAPALHPPRAPRILIVEQDSARCSSGWPATPPTSRSSA